MTTLFKIAQREILSNAFHDFEKGLNKRAYFKVHKHSTSDELVQDTFTKTWSYLIKGGKIITIKAFLYHVLNNLIIDEYRKRKTLSLDEMMENGYELGKDETENLVDGLDGKSAMLLIGKLPIKYQTVLRMKYMQSLSLKEISTLSGSTPNNVAVQLHRGLEKLKVLYNHI